MKMPFDFRGKSLENRRRQGNEIDENEWDMLDDDYWTDFESLSGEDSDDEEERQEEYEALEEEEESYAEDIVEAYEAEGYQEEEELQFEEEAYAEEQDAYYSAEVEQYEAEGGQYEQEEYYEAEGGQYEQQEYYEAEGGQYEQQEYYEAEGGQYEQQEYYEAEDGQYEQQEYYEAEDGQYEQQEYYEAEDGQYEQQEYYEAEDEQYEQQEAYYESEEAETAYYEDREEEYYAEQTKHTLPEEYYTEDDDAEIMPYISMSKIMDYLIILGGVAVVLVALVLGGSYVLRHGNQGEQDNLLAVGTQLKDISMIGEKGLVAMSDAQQALLQGMLTPEATPEPEKPNYEEDDYKIDINVKLSLTSIEKDLKIKFLNSETGKLVGNVPFGVEVTRDDGKVTFWSDDDMDGIIYKKGLEAGDYTVKVQELTDDKYKGYGLPSKEKRVEVKSKIVYEKVDIAAEIKDESQVNVQEEDTKKNETIVEEYLNDTVVWVESSVTSESYEEVSKDNIPNPTTLVMAGVFVRLAATEVPVTPPAEVTEAPVTEAPATEVPATEAPAATEVPATEAPAATEVPATEVPAATEAPAATEVPATEVPAATEAPATEAPAATEVPATETPAATEAPATETPAVTETPIPTEAPTTPIPVPTETPTATATPIPSATPVPSGSPVPTGSPEPSATPEPTPTATPVPMVIKIDKKTETVYIGTPVELKFEVQNKLKDAVVTVDSTKPNVVKAEVKDSVIVITGYEEGIANINIKCENEDFAAESVACTIVVKKDPKADKTSILKDAQGREVYVYENNMYRQATFADYYTASKFYIRKEAKYTGWQTINGQVMYYDAAGKFVTGEQVIQGVKYQFSSQGALVTGSGTMGIDVSKWNGSIDWNAVKNSGVSYVIIRVGYRGSSKGNLIEDSKFEENIKGATRAGLKVGVYFFTQAINKSEAVEEASMVLECIKDYNISYPIFLDVEPSGGRADSLDKATRTEICKAFCETVKGYGYTAGIYANKNWLESKLDMSVLNSYKIWLAQYASEPTYQGRYDMWQYKDTGKISGINTDVDLNISYLGY